MKLRGEHLRFLRSCKKEKQSCIAKKLNITQQYISKMEKAESISNITYIKYIAALGLSKNEAEKLITAFDSQLASAH